MAEHVARVATFGPDEPKLLEGYRPNAPVITFAREMRLHVGKWPAVRVAESKLPIVLSIDLNREVGNKAQGAGLG